MKRKTLIKEGGGNRKNGLRTSEGTIQKKTPNKYLMWNELNMSQAVAAVHNSCSPMQAVRLYNVPRSKLQDRLTGKSKSGTKSGCKTRLPPPEEQKLVDYACNRATLGIGFARMQFLHHAETSQKNKESHL